LRAAKYTNNNTSKDLLLWRRTR